MNDERKEPVLPWLDNPNRSVEDLLYTLHQIDVWERENGETAPSWSMPLLARGTFYDLLKRFVALEERVDK